MNLTPTELDDIEIERFVNSMQRLKLPFYSIFKKVSDTSKGSLFILTLFLFSHHSAEASEDQQEKIESLEKRISALEVENARLSSRVSELEKTDKIKNKSEFSSIVPRDKIEKKKFFDTFRREIKSSEDMSRGPWTKVESWEKIRKRMSEYGVRLALGRPTRIKPSANPKIETIYFYIGDLNADGVDEEGYVNLKDKRVVSFKSPHQQGSE